MLPVIVADTEVFRHYFLFVAKKLPSQEVVVIDNYASLHSFYQENKNAIWCFYNASYDKAIIQAALIGHDVKAVNDWIIHEGQPAFKYSEALANASRTFPINAFDVKTSGHGLKVLEAFMGEDIRETTVPFDLERELTPQEQKEVIFYCKHDVEQTFKVLQQIKPKFVSHLNICKMFSLPLTYMSKTATQLGEVLLGAKRQTYADEFNITILPEVKLNKYGEVIKWFNSQAALCNCNVMKAEEVYKLPRLTINICDIDVTFGWGGLHGAIPKYHQNGIIGCYDVTGLYSSLMVVYNFFSRSLQYPHRYKEMYETRNRLKEAGDPKNKDYKLILNSTYGALKSFYSPSYDPLIANNITVNGQLLLLMLLDMSDEFLNGSNKDLVKVINLNTDGVFLWFANDELRKQFDVYVNKWMEITHLNMEYSEFTSIHQRDVNNYIMVDAQNHVKGKGILKSKSLIDNDLPILSKAIREFFVNNVPIDETVNQATKLIDFQMVYKISSKYKCASYMGEMLTMNKVFRVFASKDYKDGTLKKIKEVKLPNGKDEIRYESFANCPVRCKIINERIVDAEVPDWLDRNWYIDLINAELETWFPEVKPIPSLVSLCDSLL